MARYLANSKTQSSIHIHLIDSIMILQIRFFCDFHEYQMLCQNISIYYERNKSAEHVTQLNYISYRTHETEYINKFFSAVSVDFYKKNNP